MGYLKLKPATTPKLQPLRGFVLNHTILGFHVGLKKTMGFTNHAGKEVVVTNPKGCQVKCCLRRRHDILSLEALQPKVHPGLGISNSKKHFGYIGYIGCG